MNVKQVTEESSTSALAMKNSYSAGETSFAERQCQRAHPLISVISGSDN